MQVTCDDLQLDPPAVADAQDSSEDAEYALSQGLEALRGSQEGTLALPAEMARLAPAPETWGGYIWPRVRGRRLFIPLFKPANVETMVAPSGYAEIVFFQRSGDTLAAPGWRWLIPLGLLAAAVGVLLRRRRRAAENGSVVMESIVQGVDEKEKEE